MNGANIYTETVLKILEFSSLKDSEHNFERILWNYYNNERQLSRNTTLQWDGTCRIPIIFKEPQAKLAEF